MRLPRTLLVSILLIGGASADDALGTFTVKGRTTRHGAGQEIADMLRKGGARE